MEIEHGMLDLQPYCQSMGRWEKPGISMSGVGWSEVAAIALTPFLPLFVDFAAYLLSTHSCKVQYCPCTSTVATYCREKSWNCLWIGIVCEVDWFPRILQGMWSVPGTYAFTSVYGMFIWVSRTIVSAGKSQICLIAIGWLTFNSDIFMHTACVILQSRTLCDSALGKKKEKKILLWCVLIKLLQVRRDAYSVFSCVVLYAVLDMSFLQNIYE